MPNIALDDPRPLPTWLKIAVSLAVVAHFLAIAGHVLSAPSGPWVPGAPPIPGPQFAMPIGELAAPYLTALRMTHTYNYRVDHSRPAVYFEVHLRDSSDRPLKSLKFPDPKANFWVRHRQLLLAESLSGDVPLPPSQGERLGAPPKTIWEPLERQANGNQADDKEYAVLKTVPEHLVPRNRPVVMAPSDWSLLAVKSYARYLCRTYGAEKAEIVRHSRDIVLPPTWLPPPPGQERSEPPPAMFQELVYNFGVHRRE